jgi:hypothetical protein
MTLEASFMRIETSNTIEQRILDTNAGKQLS